MAVFRPGGRRGGMAAPRHFTLAEQRFALHV